MLQIAEDCSRRFENDHLGTTAEVLWETRRDGVWQGTTDNYIRALKETAETLAGELRQETLLEAGVRGVACRTAGPVEAPTLTNLAGPST